MTPVTVPDDAILLKFLLGTLPEEELRTVQEWLISDPRAASKLAELQARDRVTDVLDARALAETSDAKLAQTIPQTVPPPVPDAPPERIAGYAIVREIGRGGMGVVYEAKEPQLTSRSVALKVIGDDAARDPAVRARFRNEAEAVGGIDHPNVVPVFACGEDAGRLFLVMPLLKGETLAARLTRGPLTPTELLRVARDIASALEAAHKAGLIHRDIKPANVWLDAADGRARVLDFGLVKSQEAPAHTETGAVMGSVHYMSPQQANGQPLDARTDLFSLGALLYHAATGRRPFDGDTVFAVLRAVVDATPPAPTGVSPQMAKLIRKLLEKEPAARPASASDVLLELADPVPVPPKRRFPVWALAAGLLLALAAAAIVYEVKFSNGTLVVEASPDADVRLKNGAIEVYDEAGKLKYTIAPNSRTANVPRGTYKLKVVGADGVELDTEEFTMKRNGTAVVRVTAPPVTAKDADRRAAEWVLSVGGTVAIWEGKEHRWIETASALPREPFALNAISFGKGVKHVTDEALAIFKGVERLQQLDLRDTRATDAGLAHFAGCKELMLIHLNGKRITDTGFALLPDQLELTQLGLLGTSVTDAGLARFARCKHLQELVLTDTDVTDTGLAHFRKSFELRAVVAERTRITDAGLAHLSECRDLQVLALSGTKITGAGLKPLAGCNFQRLVLSDTEFDDAGVAHLANSKLLSQLTLSGTRVTDNGLAALPPLPALVTLDLRKTRVTAATVAALAKARPKCEITWDGGTIAPASDSDRRAALWVLSLGEQVLVWEGNDHRFIDAANALPREPFPLWAPHIKKNPQAVTDEKLAVFKDCTRVKQLDLPGTRITDAGLAHFALCKELDYIELNGNGITDKGLAHLAGLANLTHLSLSGTRVTDAGLAHFAKCKRLQYVTLSDTKVADAGLAHLRECVELRYLRLEGTFVTDAGLAHLSACRDLDMLRLCNTRTTSAALKPLSNCNFVNLDLTGTDFDDTGFVHLKNSTNLRLAVLQKTKVTNAGVAALAKERPNCRIVWDGGTVEPKSTEPRVEALLPPKVRLLFEEKFRNVKDGNLVGQGLWTGEYVRVKNGMIDLQEPPQKDDPITRKLAHLLYARRPVEKAPDAVEFIVGLEALAYSSNDQSKFKANNTTIFARRRSDVYIGWNQQTSGKQPEWLFDARKRDGDYGKVAPHDSPNCVIVPGGHDRWVALTIHFDLKAKEVYGSYDFGDGVKRTKRISVKDRNIDTLEMVEILTDFRANNRGMLIKSISAWAVEK